MKIIVLLIACLFLLMCYCLGYYRRKAQHYFTLCYIYVHKLLEFGDTPKYDPNNKYWKDATLKTLLDKDDINYLFKLTHNPFIERTIKK